MSFFMIFISIKCENFVISTLINITCFVVRQTFFYVVLYNLLVTKLKPKYIADF